MYQVVEYRAGKWQYMTLNIVLTIMLTYCMIGCNTWSLMRKKDYEISTYILRSFIVLCKRALGSWPPSPFGPPWPFGPLGLLASLLKTQKDKKIGQGLSDDSSEFFSHSDYTLVPDDSYPKKLFHQGCVIVLAFFL